jgi:hypothetical protein
VSKNQIIPAETEGEKWVKNAAKHSQPAKNQILTTAVEIPSATRFPQATSANILRIFHLMTPLFCSFFADNMMFSSEG